MWLLFAMGSALIFASQELLMRILAVKSSVPRVFSVVFNAWGALFAIIIFIFQGGSFADLLNLSSSHILLIVSAIILFGLYERYQFIARKGVEASSLAIIFRLETIIAFIGTMFFLHEPLTGAKLVGTALVVCASLLLVYRNPKLRLSRAFFYAILCAVLMGTVMVVDKPASANIQPALYSFIVWCIPIFIIIFPGIKKVDLVNEVKIGGWKVAVAALLNVVGYIFYIQAFALADASRVIPVVAINSILIVLGGILLLHEHDHLWRKLIAGAIAFAGVYFLK